eukprot:SAG11_NODE_18829_length_480_cov_0.947507_1_plen_107_part_01
MHIEMPKHALSDDDEEIGPPRPADDEEEVGPPRPPPDADDDEEEVGPPRPPADAMDDGAEAGPVVPRKKRKALEFERLYLDALPSCEMYEKSYMHRGDVTDILVTPN